MVIENRNVVPVVFASDENFFMPTCVSITSLLTNAKEDTFYDIYILIGEKFREEYKEKTELFYNVFKNFQITYINIVNTLANMIVKNTKLKIQAYYRLFISEVLKHYDKCIYLDEDTIVEKDLQELYDIDMEKYCIAGVKGIFSNNRKDYCESIGLPSMEQYINSGVLLMNLKLIRDMKINEKYKELAVSNLYFPSDDQDVLNLTCYNYIKHIPLKYNCMMFRLNEKTCKLFTEEEISEARQDPVIIHFANSGVKPWDNIRCIFADRWWKYANISPYQKELKKIFPELDVSYNLKKLFEKIKNEKEIIIFGYSEIGKKIFDILNKIGIKSIKGFCDNSLEKQKEKFAVPIFSVLEAISKYPEAVFLISSQNYYKEIKAQLLDGGIVEEKIIRYINKNYDFYKSEDEKFYEEELKESFFIETGKILNLENPKTFCEKLNWLKLHDKDPRKTLLADKYWVREEVKRRIGDKYLIPLLGVYDTFEEIDFTTLPDEFIIKANHGCAWNIVVKDKNKINIDEISRKFNEWLAINFAYANKFELHYSDIKPKIVIEKYIEDSKGELYDYRFLCFDGKPEYCILDSGGPSNRRRNIYNLKWEKQDFTINNCPSLEEEVPKPNNLEEMISIVEKLSKGFKHVRIDLYNVDGNIYFGEYTFTSMSGVLKFSEEKYDLELGNLINLK